MKKVIETGVPINILFSSTIGEKVKKGHPGKLHPWWSRSPIVSSAALLKTALDDATQDNEDHQFHYTSFIQSFKDGKAGRYPSSGFPTVCDPFAGFGGLLIAAQRLGLNIFASDLNPVAVVLNQAAIGIPARFADQYAVNPKATTMLYHGSIGLAEDVAYYGKKLAGKVHAKLKERYPSAGLPETKQEFPVFSWVWVRTMPCPNPACGHEMPLASSFILSKSKGREYWAEPDLADRQLSFLIHHGACPTGKESNKHGSRGAKFICPYCGHITQDEDVVRAGKTGCLSSTLMAVSVETEQGRIFISPDDAQIKAARCEMPEDTPTENISHNARWFSPPRFGITEFAELFTPRQMLLLTTFCTELPAIMEEVQQDALAKGMADDGISLAQKGKGALAYSQAIGVYLSLMISKLTDYQSAYCTWDNRKGNIRSVFNRQALPMAWVYGEGNPFSSPIGNLASILKSEVNAIADLQATSHAEVIQSDALDVQFPKNAILFTELPYYDNVGYAELSNYFYVWLKKCLGNIYPDLFHSDLTPKDEICSIPEHFAGNSDDAIKTYQQKIQELFTRFYASASNKFPSIVFFCYREADRQESFDFLLEGILAAGFIITGMWPMRLSRNEDGKSLVRVAVVFRKRIEEGKVTTRRGFINALKHKLPSMLDVAYTTDMLEEDRDIIGQGMGLQVLAEFQTVINADGTDLSLPDALQLIIQEVKEYEKIHPAEMQMGEE